MYAGMIELNGVTVKIAEKTLVQDVSMQVRPGRVGVLIGPNGAGKSTLLRIATGEHLPVKGNVTVDETPLSACSSRSLAQRRAVVRQHSSLTFPFPVLEVVLMGRTPHLKGSETRRDIDIAWAAMVKTGVAHLAHQSYTTLSGGERQRVDVARALTQIWDEVPGHNRYLLLDEPTASLDIAHQHDTLKLVREIAACGVGILVVLHDLNLAAQYADDIVVLHQGCCLARGGPVEVLNPDIIEKAFSLSVLVTAHPCQDCPLIVPMPATQPLVASS